MNIICKVFGHNFETLKSTSPVGIKKVNNPTGTAAEISIECYGCRRCDEIKCVPSFKLNVLDAKPAPKTTTQIKPKGK